VTQPVVRTSPAGRPDRAIGIRVAGAGLVGAVPPSAVGILLNRDNVNLLGPALMALSMLLIVLYLVLRRPPDRVEPDGAAWNTL
jgi:hypothetical protein